MPEISIIVPVYKVEKYLNRCVESILKQTFSDFELILVDDGSPDNCPRMCDEWAKKDNRIRVIHKENGGAGQARNAGLKNAIGKYIGFVDADDWIAPQMYEELYKMLKLHDDAQIAMCQLVKTSDMHFEKKNNNKKAEFLDVSGMMKYFFRVNGEKSNYSVCNKLLCKDILREFKFTEGTISEDVEANYFFYTHSKGMMMSPNVYYYYFVNDEGVTKSAVTKKDLEYINVWNRVKEEQKNNALFYKYSEINYARAHFTILSKMKLYGYDKGDSELRELYVSLKKCVRRYFWKLLRWKMPITRKVLLCYVIL